MMIEITDSMDSNPIRVRYNFTQNMTRRLKLKFLGCKKRSGPGLLKCCPNLEGPNALYGPSKQCCPGSGEVISIGDQCSY